MGTENDSRFEEFVVARSAALLRFAYVLSGDRGLAEDLVQEALLKAHRHWARVSSLEGPEAYVRRIVSNEYLSWRRRRASSEVVGVLPDTPGAADADPEIVERERLWSALRTLPPRQRAVLALRYYEDLSEAETARLLGCTGSTVRSLQSRALHALRPRLDEGSNPLSGRGGRGHA